MKVLHVIPSLAPARGGPSTALPLFERALAAEGVTVETATTDDDGPGRRSPRPPETVEGGIRRLWFPKQAEFYTRSAPFRRWIGAHVRDYDLVHVHALFSDVSISAALAARRAGVPYVIRPCGALTRYGMATRPLLKRVSLALFEARALRGAAAVQVTSAQERDEALELGVPMRPWLLPLGIDDPGAGRAERFLARHPQADGRPRLLFLSRLHPKKNLEVAIDALALLGDGPAAPVLIVCGEGEAGYRQALAARAAGRGVAGRIVWAGFVTGADKADALAAGDLFVLPSLSENFGIAAVEALFAGLPCVLGEGVALAGEIAAAGLGAAVAPTAEAVAGGIRAMLAHPDRDALPARARSFAAARYSVAAMGRALRLDYERMIAAADAARGGR